MAFSSTFFSSITQKMSVVLLVVSLFCGFAGSVSVMAQSQVPSECKAQSAISVADLFQPQKFIPLIPAACGTTTNAQGQTVARSLSLDAFPYILIRLFQLLSTLVFYFFSLSVVVFGIQWIINSVTDSQSTFTLMGKMRNAIFGLVMVGLAYTFVATIATIFQLEPSVYLNGSPTDFFN